MEPVSAGASVLAFVGIALQGTKSLYNVLSGFRHATRETASLVAAVGNLRNILIQLRDCRALAEPNVDLQNVRNLLDACTQDIANFKKDLDKIQYDPTTPKIQKAWKRVRAALTEKQLTAMWHKLNHHCNVLQFQLNLLQSNDTLDCKTQIHEIRDTLSAGTLQISSLNENVQDIKDSVEEVVRSTAAAVNHTIGQTSGATLAQLQNISTLLEALQNQVSADATQFSLPQHCRAPTQEDSPLFAHSNEPVRGNLELRECLARLCKLESQVSGTMLYEEADTIIEDLECFLSELMELEDSEVLGTAKKRKKEIGEDETVTRRDLKRMRGLVSASPAVEVNQAPKRFTTKSAGKVVQKNRSIELVLSGCRATITINKRAFQAFGNPSEPGELTTGPYAEEFFATVKASIEDSKSPAVLVAYLRQIRFDNGFSSLNPVISIGKTLPRSSAIFDIVRNGDVEGLRRLLARGEGSLRDRDTKGIPLLHYAVAYSEGRKTDDMCAFLIQNGADVDEVAHDPSSAFGMSQTPMWLSGGNPEVARLLLVAGADPCSALYLRTGDSNSKYSMLRFGDHGMKLILSNPIPFVDIESRDSRGRTMLLSVAADCARLRDPVSFLNLLLSKSADNGARDKYGRNCLQLALRSFWHQYQADKVRQCIVFLIRSGADIHSVDGEGISISDEAYKDPTATMLGSGRGDVWDAALSVCGYDIRQMRHGYHRLPRYDDTECPIYQRKFFKYLWKGREDACPYYHDPPVWCPRSILPSGQCPFGGEDWLCPGTNAAFSQDAKTDDLYGADDIVRARSEDSHRIEEAKFYGVSESKESDSTDSSNAHAELSSRTAPMRDIAQEDPAAESASDSSSEYNDTYEYI
ncbi:hypothetical protein AYO22_01998 [Fonsecaea multimorphosa]|nr:hypothetical protein AYO22_01998 [Fonsecaea multimorphosa]